jgi:uncharacterized protein YndB with AHSA1/START domain
MFRSNSSGKPGPHPSICATGSRRNLGLSLPASSIRPGGSINFTMRSPEGQEFPNTQCYLEVSPFERLVITDTLLGGYRPSPNPFFTAVLELAKNGNGTRYKAIAIHGNDEARKKHEEMGFHDGWGTVVKQMVEYIKAGGMRC